MNSKNVEVRLVIILWEAKGLGGAVVLRSGAITTNNQHHPGLPGCFRI